MKKMFLTSMLTLGMLALNAQEVSDQLPANPEDGKCYAKCVEPDEYREETVKVMVKPAYKTLKVLPAEYKTVTETIVEKPESKKYIYIPAKYKTVTDTVWVQEGYDKLTVLDAEFRNDVETVELKSTYGKWIAGEKDPDCPSINPEDCRVFHYKVTPAVTKDFPIEKLVKNETTESKEIIGKYVVVSREVEVDPATYNEEVIPEVKKEITKEVLVKNESTEEIEIPAEYMDVTKKVLVKAGGMTIWREVPCTIPADEEVLPITWNVGSAEITPTAARIIDNKLLSVAKERKNSIIEIGSHTDARGTAESNQKLSERRAKAVVEYLISKGINKDRLLAVGYGETKLKNKCADGVQCPDSQHAANRRTEFKVY